MLSLRIITRGLLEGKSLVRIYQNAALMQAPLFGRVLDIGSGGDRSYLSFLPTVAGRTFESIDPKGGEVIDFERDVLPYGQDVFDAVLLLNVLEHVFAYDHLLSETHRVLKGGCPLVGFTPFLVRYHPDPHDFFRYTDEALRRILERAQYRVSEIIPVGEGPVLAGLNVFILSLPRILRPVVATVAWCFDATFLHFRPRAQRVYPMGYYFVARKI